MNENKPEKKGERPVAIAGFIAIIIIIAWIAVQIVQFAPKAFSSLASIADGINQYKEGLSGDIDGPLKVASDTASTTDGSPVTVTWEKDSRAGRYTFSHGCHEGVIVDIIDTDGLREITCDTTYDLGDTDTLTFMINSTKDGVVQVPYTISFMRKNDTGPIRTGGGTVAIDDKSSVVAVADPDEGTVLGESDSSDFEAAQPPAPAPKPKAPSAPKVTAAPTPTITYVLPTSDPRGYIDLSTSLIQTGSLTGNTFKAGTMEQNEDGAIRFSIKNNGTKVSGKWTYSVTLPGNDTYVSPLQAPLMPTEEVIITIGFSVDDTSRHTFTVVAAEANDTKLSNNATSKSVTFTR
jgi:hypothetical protein